MNNSPGSLFRRRLWLVVLVFVLGHFAAPAARAGLTFTLDIIRYSHGNNYRFFTPLDTNSTPPAAPLGTYFISSPFYSQQHPTNGSWREIVVSSNGVNTVDGIENPYTDFNSVMQQITNGTWTMVFTNNTTTNTYTFRVSAPNMTSNMLPATVIIYPSAGALDIPNQPDFTWQAPANLPLNGAYSYLANRDFSFYQPVSIPAGQTNWIIPTPIPNGVNCTFNIDYQTNHLSPIFMASTPLDTNSQPFQGWGSADVLDTGDSVYFAVTNPPATTTVLVAHYTFDNSGNLGQDSSGNGYDLDFNGGDVVTFTNGVTVRSGAAYFDGNSYFSYNSTPTNVLNALAGDFTLSFWIKTTQNDGNENGDAYAGDGIVAEDIPGTGFDLVPAALDGGEVGFNTGGNFGDDTVNSTTDINDGNYHHVVITRDEAMGEKQIYIDGVLNNSQFATMNPLSDPRIVAIGCAIDGSQTDPNNASPHEYFLGSLDDLQLYSGVLSSNQVAQLYQNPGSTAGQGITAPLVARYDFEDVNSPGTDSSGHNNNAPATAVDVPVDIANTNAAVGAYARQYFGNSYLYFAPGSSEFQSLSNALSGSFSWTAWVMSTNSVNADYANAYFGTPIFFDYNSNTNRAIFSITGSKAAFTIGNPNGTDTTLHSTTSVNDGSYHFLAVTRNPTNGVVNVYVDGNLEATDISSNGPVVATSTMRLAGGYFTNFVGLLDDVRIYGGELSASEVATLSGHPPSDFNTALNTTDLTWNTGGDNSWFVESTNTQDNVSAAQSGIVTNNQSSSLSVTVTGPGTLTFYWSSQGAGNNFDYVCYLDGDSNNGYLDDIYYNTAWYQDGSFNIPAGQHTISWTAYSNGDNDPTQAGFLDQVSYIAAPTNSAPIITVNPFNQTNYPGYNVALYAAATSNPTATWQWFKIGSGSIAGATTNFYIPTNSGTVGVAGSYFAVANNNQGSANTTTAAVTFVSAPLPPDWSLAMKSPFQSVDSSQFNKDYYLGCAVDPAGEVYAAAQYFGNMDVLVDGSPENVLTAVGTNGAAALVKHAANGKPVWGVGLTNNQAGSFSYGIAVAVAPGNGAYLASILSGTNWLGTNKFVDAGGSSILLSRFDSSGSNVWSQFIGGNNYVYTSYNMLVADAAGNVTLAGNMDGTINFGGTNLSAPSGGGFIVQYDPTGVVHWAQTVPNNISGLAYGGGRLYASLQTTVSGGVTNISAGSLSNLTDRAWAVACLDATNGQALWLRGVGDQYGVHTTGIINDQPRVSVAGTNVFLLANAYGSSVMFGNLSVPLPASAGQYFARYDTDGHPQTANVFGGTSTTIWSVAANASGVYVSGDFDDYSQFGSDVIAAPVYAQNDLGPLFFTQPFLAKFDRNGNPLWARNGVSSDLANFRGIATTSDGVWACGFLKLNSLGTLAQFGTNYVYGDYYIVSVGIFGTIYPTQGGMIAKVTESSASALPVTILNPQANGVNFQFSFLSQAGFNHSILYRTNLTTAGGWLTNSTVAGDGTVKPVSVPLSIFNPSKQGFIRVTTQ